MFSCEFCEHLSRNPFFYRTPQVAASVKGCKFTKIWLRHGCYFVNFLKIFWTIFWCAARIFWKFTKKLVEKCLLNISLQMAVWLLMITTMLFSYTRMFACTSSPWNTRATHLRSSTTFLSRLKFWFVKQLKINLNIILRERSFCKLLRPCKSSRCF